MGIEIERKFLIDLQKIPPLKKGNVIRQGYIKTENYVTVRVRISDEKAFLTLKGKNRGILRSEYEYSIPLNEAYEIIDELCEKNVIYKTRYLLDHAGHTWEIDIFEGDNEGLIIAEVELDSEMELIEIPEWVTKEVTGDQKYYNSSLSRHPYLQWNIKENQH